MSYEINANELSCTLWNFKETRVCAVITDYTDMNFNPNRCSDSDFYTEAEKQGFVWTLKGFERFIYEGKLNGLTKDLPSDHYFVPRFIDMYEKDGVVYCNNEPRTDEDNKI